MKILKRIKKLLGIKSPSNPLSEKQLQDLKLSFKESIEAYNNYCDYKVDYYTKAKNEQANSN